jgi:hypothetical protein
MHKDLIDQYSQLLLKEGWVKEEPQFDLNYFITLDFSSVVKNLSYCISEIGHKCQTNIFGFLSEDVEKERSKFLSTICPNNKICFLESNSPQLQANYPIIKNDYENQEAAFEELTYLIIQRVINYLGTPHKIAQILGEDATLTTFIINQSTDIKNISILARLFLVWDDVVITAERGERWHDNGSISKLSYHLKSKNLKQLVSNVVGGIAMEINSNTYQIGSPSPKYKLSSFPSYIKNYTNDLIELINNNTIDRLNVLIEGPPGTGKSSWCLSFATEILTNYDYLIMIVDYNSLQTLVIPDYLSKICLIINDVDTLALDRSNSVKGETEQVMGWLDGTRTSFIKPFYSQESKSIITLMTANSVERWDKAALRQGRIHRHLLFDQKQLCETNDYKL